MTFGISFVVIIANIYYSIMLIQDLDKTKLNTLIATMANCIPYITETMVFCHLCNSTSEEVRVLNFQNKKYVSFSQLKKM